MKVTTQEVEQRQVVLEVEVEDERVQRALDQAYKRIVNRINVPGFRKGRAPRPLVERMVGREALLEDAVEHLVPQVYRDALQEQQIEPGGQPSLEVTSTDPLQFKATVPLKPKVELGDYRSIQVEVKPVVVEDEEVDRVVKNLRESHSTWVPVEREAQVGDRVGLDIKATREGRTTIDNENIEFVVNPDGPEPVEGFSTQLVGMQAGEERTFSLGGQPVAAPVEEPPAESGDSGETEAPILTPVTEFWVKLQWVKERELPEVDDEFARTVGEKETVEELRDEIRGRIREHKEQEGREERREAVVEQAIERASVVMAPQLVESQAQTLLDNLASRLDRQGISVEQYLKITGKDEDSFRSELMSEADRTLRRDLVLDAIAEAEGVTVSEAELREEIEAVIQVSREPSKSLQRSLARPEARARIESMLRTRKAVVLLESLSAGSSDGASPSEEAAEPIGETHG